MAKDELIKIARNNHMYHLPNTDSRIQKHTQVREVTLKCAEALIELCPISKELSLALTAMEEAMMWANAAIARNAD